MPENEGEKLSPAQAQQFLEGMEYPASKGDLVDHARDHGADNRVISFLERIPDREYTGPTTVSEEIGALEGENK